MRRVAWRLRRRQGGERPGGLLSNAPGRARAGRFAPPRRDEPSAIAAQHRADGGPAACAPVAVILSLGPGGKRHVMR